MNSIKIAAGFAALFASISGVGVYAAAQAGGGDLLGQIERGRWLLRSVGGASAALPVNQLCVTDPKMLAQIEHRSSPQCSHFVVRSTATSVTISYSCRGSGQGLTTIRKETDKLIQIQSQGVFNGEPFSFSAEGRHGGAC